MQDDWIKALPIDTDRFYQKCFDFLSNYVPFDEDKLFVAGGIFTRLYWNLPLNDIDVYCGSQETLRNTVKEYLKRGYSIEIGNVERRYLKLSKNNENIKIDLIGYHDPKDFSYIKSFDLCHCMIAMDQDKVYTSLNNPIDLIKRKSIQINLGATFNIKPAGNANNTISRIMKYKELGFTIEPLEIEGLYNTLLYKDPSKLKSSPY